MTDLTIQQEQILGRALTLYPDVDQTKVDKIKNAIKYTYDIDHVSYTDEMVKALVNDIIYDENLFITCIVPPFSTLDTKQGYWKDRRTLLEEYLGDSTIGRKENLTFSSNLKFGERDTGTSRFDAALCEILIKWFGIQKGLVVDTYAGGHIRGCMTSLCGMNYIGVDLNKEQIEANIRRNNELGLNNIAWHHDDAQNLDSYVKDGTADLIFTCPPYGDLEKYTDDPRDLSNMDYDSFIKIYGDIAKKSIAKLKDNRFAVIVVGDFRDDKGFYRGFCKDTILAYEAAGAKLYNEMILLNSITTASFRANNSFRNRKMVKIHQNVLVFFKGDPKMIQGDFGKIDAKIPIPTKKQQGLFI